MRGQFIFLDDIRTPLGTTHVTIPNYPYTIVRDYWEFCIAVEEYYKDIGEAPCYVTFDHDLNCIDYIENPDYDGRDEKTGFHCAKWLIEFCEKYNLDFPEYGVHSMNPIGKENIVSLIESYKKVKKK
jgi:hypothetical protein